MPMGHNDRTITSANAVMMLRCAGVYDNYVRIQGFQADNAWEFGEVNIGETRMGVDGKQSIGYTPHETSWAIHLEANSPSVQIMENIRKYFNSNMEVAFIEVIIEMPSIAKKYYGKGGMVSMTGGASGKKLLDGTTYNFNMVTEGAEEI